MVRLNNLLSFSCSTAFLELCRAPLLGPQMSHSKCTLVSTLTHFFCLMYRLLDREMESHTPLRRKLYTETYSDAKFGNRASLIGCVDADRYRVNVFLRD